MSVFWADFESKGGRKGLSINYVYYVFYQVDLKPENTAAGAIIEDGNRQDGFPELEQRHSSSDRIDIIVTNSRDEKNEERVSPIRRIKTNLIFLIYHKKDNYPFQRT